MAIKISGVDTVEMWVMTSRDLSVAYSATVCGCCHLVGIGNNIKTDLRLFV